MAVASAQTLGLAVKHLLHSLDSALAEENHYAALALALAMPDICGWVAEPTLGSKARYIAWFERYLQPIYTRPATSYRPEHIFLTGSDFYALRCAYLHEGRDEITEQRSREILESFIFVVPPRGWTVHLNQSGGKLQLQVDIFCREIGKGVHSFIANIANDAEATQRMNQLLVLRNVNGEPL